MKWGVTPTRPDLWDLPACQAWNADRDAALAMLPALRAELVKAEAFGREATPKEIMTLLELTFSRYYAPDRDEATERALMREWLSDLRGVSIGRLKACLKAWRGKSDFAPRAYGPLLALSTTCNSHQAKRIRDAIANIEASTPARPMTQAELDEREAQIALADARAKAERQERERQEAVERERLEAERKAKAREGHKARIRQYTIALTAAEANGEDAEASLLRASIKSAERALGGAA